MPDSCLETTSRSIMEGASASCSGEVTWHASGLDEGTKEERGVQYHGIDHGAN